MAVTKHPTLKSVEPVLKHVVVAVSLKGLPQQYLKEVSGRVAVFTPDLGDALLLISRDSAKVRLRKAIALNMERELGVSLVLGEVSLSVTALVEPQDKPERVGYLLRRKDGQYYCGPKGRNANSFHEAHYRYKPNPDVATVLPTLALALERAEGILAELRRAVRPSDTHKHVYEECVVGGHCEVIDAATGRIVPPVAASSRPPASGSRAA